MKLIRPSKLTDDEYVGWIKEKDRNVRRSRWVHPVCLLVNVGVIYLVARNFSFVLELPQSSCLAVLAFVAGVLYGGVLLFLLFSTIGAVMAWWDVRNGHRTERLLLRYYDENRKIRSSSQASHAPSEPAPGADSSAHQG